jgi:hypothetical protein
MTIPDDSETDIVQGDSEHMPADAENIDWLLQKLVCNVDINDGLEIGITLQVSGMLVSGSLTGGKEYYKEFTRFHSGCFSDPSVSSKVAADFGSHAGIFENDPASITDDFFLPQFIHLKNAKFINTSGRPISSNSGILWRGKISSVDGFFLGVLAVGET